MNGMFEALLNKPKDVEPKKIYFIKEDNDVNVYLGTSDKKLQYIGKNLGDETVLPKELKDKSIMEMFAYLFHYANSSKVKLKLLVGNAVGTDYSKQADELIANDIIDKKSKIVESLQNKGIGANKFDDLGTYADKINSIVQNPKLKNTKLNIQAPFKKEIELLQPIKLQNICTSVLEFEVGKDNVVQYECNFDNGDSVNFNLKNSVIFNDGKMKQENKEKSYDYDKGNDTDKGKEYLVEVNFDDFYKVSTIEENEDEEEGINQLIFKGTDNPILITAKDDINISGVERLNKITWTAQTQNSSKLLLLISTDSGITWKGIKDDKVETIDIQKLDDIRNKGLSIEKVNSLNISDLAKLRDDNPKIRFGYYFDKTDDKDDVYNDKIQLSVDMRGADKFTNNCTIDLSEDGRTITYTFTKDGTYTINTVLGDVVTMKEEKSMEEQLIK